MSLFGMARLPCRNQHIRFSARFQIVHRAEFLSQYFVVQNHGFRNLCTSENAAYAVGTDTTNNIPTLKYEKVTPRDESMIILTPKIIPAIAEKTAQAKKPE